MRSSPTSKCGIACVVLAFVLANGLSVSNAHELSHGTAGSTGAWAAESHETAHGAAGAEGHGHDAAAECSCLGTCAGATPPVLASNPIGAEGGSAFARQGAIRWPTRRVARRATAYLVPLPNPPPVRA